MKETEKEDSSHAIFFVFDKSINCLVSAIYTFIYLHRRQFAWYYFVLYTVLIFRRVLGIAISILFVFIICLVIFSM